MTITWLGHSCFCIEEDGYRIVLDPYVPMGGYGELSVSAHEVLCSHDHFDHNCTAAVTLLPKKDSPFTVRTVDTFHDDQGGALRGKNKVHILSANGKTVVHLGDLGHLPTGEQIAAIGACDALLIPIGGYYTIDAAQAFDAATALAPKTILPMHYSFESYGFPEIGGLEAFTALFPNEEIAYLKTNTLTLDAQEYPAVTVLTYLPPTRK